MGVGAIFLDRDGVLNENRRDHVTSWREFAFLPGVHQALRQLASLGLPIIVVTNQAIVNRGIASRAAVEAIHQRMVAELRDSGGQIDAVRYCPHHQGEQCDCRKPSPGMLLDAAAEFDIDLSHSILVGDAATDVLAGKRAGCQTVLVLTGRGREALASLQHQPAAITVPIITARLTSVPTLVACDADLLVTNGVLRDQAAPLVATETEPAYIS